MRAVKVTVEERTFPPVNRRDVIFEDGKKWQLIDSEIINPESKKRGFSFHVFDIHLITPGDFIKVWPVVKTSTVMPEGYNSMVTKSRVKSIKIIES